MRLRCFFAVFAIIIIVFPVAGEENLQTLLSSGDEALSIREQGDNCRLAFEIFVKACSLDPNSYEAHYKAAKSAYFYGEGLSEKEKIPIYEKGITLGKRAVALNPKGPEGHFWLGVIYGVYGEAKGVMKSLSLVDDIKAEMKSAIEIDPSVECYGSYRVLGRLEYKVPGLFGGSNKRSLENLEMAVKKCPSNHLARLYLADTLIAMKDKERAKKELRFIIETPPDPRWKAEYPEQKAKAEALLNKLK